MSDTKTDLVEKVARATAEAQGDFLTTADLMDSAYEDGARAAIAAVLHPVREHLDGFLQSAKAYDAGSKFVLGQISACESLLRALDRIENGE